MPNNETNPTPTEALDLLSRACSQLKLTLEEHLLLNKCVVVLKDYIDKTPDNRPVN